MFAWWLTSTSIHSDMRSPALRSALQLSALLCSVLSLLFLHSTLLCSAFTAPFPTPPNLAPAPALRRPPPHAPSPPLPPSPPPPPLLLSPPTPAPSPSPPSLSPTCPLGGGCDLLLLLLCSCIALVLIFSSLSLLSPLSQASSPQSLLLPFTFSSPSLHLLFSLPFQHFMSPLSLFFINK